MRFFTSILFLFITLGAPSSLFALDPQKSIAQYGQNVWLRKNGLPANAVNVVLQTHDGYIWLGTSAGLFRFDGVNFTKVNLDAEKRREQMKRSLHCLNLKTAVFGSARGTTDCAVLKMEKYFATARKKVFKIHKY